MNPADAYPPFEYLRDEVETRSPGSSPVDSLALMIRCSIEESRRLIYGVQPITDEWARRIGDGLGTSKELWLGVQKAWDEWLRDGEAKVRE